MDLTPPVEDVDFNPQAGWLEDTDVNPLLRLPVELLGVVLRPQLAVSEARLVCRRFRQAFDAGAQRITVRVGTCDCAGAEVAHLWRAAARMPALAAVSLDLAWCGLGDGGMKELAVALCSGRSPSSPAAYPSPVLLDLDLSRNDIRELGAAHLAAALSAPAFLARVRALRLNLGHNSLANDYDDGGAVLLARALSSPAMAQRLVSLDLWGTRLSDGGLTAVASMLQASSSNLSAIQELKLTDADFDNSLDDALTLDGMAAVCSALQGSTHLRNLRSLAMGCGSWGIDYPEACPASAVCESPHLASLEELRMEAWYMAQYESAAFSAALGQATHLTRLRVLDLRGDFVDSESLAAALAAGTHLAALEQLRLVRCDIDDAGAKAFADAVRCSMHLSRLRVLCLDNCSIGTAGARALAEALEASRHLSGLEELRLPRNPLSDIGVAALAQALRAATHLVRLRVLDLSETESGTPTDLATGGMLQLLGDALLAGTHLSGLRALHLKDLESTCYDFEQFAAALRSATHLSGLQVLELRGTCGIAQALTLLQPGTPLTGIQELSISIRAGGEADAEDPDEAECALQRLHLPSLQHLSLGLTSLSCAEELSMALPAAAHLSTLTRLEVLVRGDCGGPDGVAMLVEALHAGEHLTALRALCLWFNEDDEDLSDATWARIGSLVGAPHMSGLRELGLLGDTDELLPSRFVAALPRGCTSGQLRIVTRSPSLFD